MSVGQRYVYHTYQGLAALFAEPHGAEGEPDEPLRFKLYRDAPYYPLSQTLPLKLGDARWSFPSYRTDTSDAPQATLTLETISQLLYYSYGFSRQDLGAQVAWPFHRLTPSARCFFPTELYAWLPSVGPLPAGIYHYDPAHHRLALLRPGDYRALLGALLAADLRDCGPILLTTSLFWKTAFRYRNFAYRLCTQEAGLVAGNALLVGAALGWHGHVHYQFLDQPLNHLLGCETDEESTLAVLPFYAAPRLLLRSHPDTDEAARAELPALRLHYLKRSSLDRASCALLCEIDHASQLRTTAAIRTLPPALRVCDAAVARAAPAPERAPVELAAALHARSSGDVEFNPLATPLAYDQFWEIVRNALAPYTSDLSASSAAPRLECYLVINHVIGIAPGVYRLCGSCDALHQVALGSSMAQLHAIQPGMNCSGASVVCYLVSRSGGVDPALGARSYRVLHFESGIVAQRLAVLGAAYGLVARCSDSFNVEHCCALLQLGATEALPLLQIALGYERPGSGAGLRYRFAIRF
jgi:SagB-type dehydrogenase family enzyme